MWFPLISCVFYAFPFPVAPWRIVEIVPVAVQPKDFIRRRCFSIECLGTVARVSRLPSQHWKSTNLHRKQWKLHALPARCISLALMAWCKRGCNSMWRQKGTRKWYKQQPKGHKECSTSPRQGWRLWNHVISQGMLAPKQHIVSWKLVRFSWLIPPIASCTLRIQLVVCVRPTICHLVWMNSACLAPQF